MGQARQEALSRARHSATRAEGATFKAMLEAALEGKAKGTWQLHAGQQPKAYRNCWLLKTPPRWRVPLGCPCAPRPLHISVLLHRACSLASWSLPGKAVAPRCGSPLSTFSSLQLQAAPFQPRRPPKFYLPAGSVSLLLWCSFHLPPVPFSFLSIHPTTFPYAQRDGVQPQPHEHTPQPPSPKPLAASPLHHPACPRLPSISGRPLPASPPRRCLTVPLC